MGVHEIVMVAIERLRAHSANANVMSREMLEKLKAHLREGGRYEPLVVRPHPEEAGAYQLINGHHRKLALEALGHTHAACLVWSLSDAQTLMLLATINRLSGRDSAGRRLKLLEELQANFAGEVERLAALVPEDAETLAALGRREVSLPRAAPVLEEMPEAFTVFLKRADKQHLLAALKRTHADAAQALLLWAEKMV